MTSYIQPHDAVFANYYSLLSLPVIKTLQEENDQLRRENARLRNVLLTSLEKQVISADPEVRFVLPLGPSFADLLPAGRVSDRLPGVQRTVSTEPVHEPVREPVVPSALDPALETLQREYVKTEKMPACAASQKDANSVVLVEPVPPTPFVVVSDEEDETVHFQDSIVESPVPTEVEEPMPEPVQEEQVPEQVQEESVHDEQEQVEEDEEPVEKPVEEEEVEELVQNEVDDDEGDTLQEVVIGDKTYYVETAEEGADVFEESGELCGRLAIKKSFWVDKTQAEKPAGEDSVCEPVEDSEGKDWFIDEVGNAFVAVSEEEPGNYAGAWSCRIVYALQGNDVGTTGKSVVEASVEEPDDDVEEAEIDGVLYFVSNGGAEGCRVYEHISDEEVGELLGHVRDGAVVRV